MKTAGKRTNIALYIAGALLLLTVLSLYITTGLYAKYISSSENEENAHAAAFYLEAKGTLLSKSFTIDNVIPGTNVERDLKIINKSEVKMRYVLTVKNETKNLPITFTITNDDTSDAYDSIDGVCVIEMELDPSESIDNYTLTVNWEVSDEVEDENLQYMGMLDHIVVTIEAEQVD